MIYKVQMVDGQIPALFRAVQTWLFNCVYFLYMRSMAPEQELEKLRAAAHVKPLESQTTPGKAAKKQRLGGDDVTPKNLSEELQVCMAKKKYRIM